MLPSIGSTKKTVLIISTVAPSLLISAPAFSWISVSAQNLRWVVLLLAGEAALLMMGFTWREIRRIFAHAAGRTVPGTDDVLSCRFWEAAARNALNLGVLGTLVGFVIQVCSDSGGPGGFLSAFGTGLLSTTFGIILASIFFSISLKFRLKVPDNSASEGMDDSGAQQQTQKSSQFRSYLPGYLVFSGLFLWILLSPASAGSYRPIDWFVHWPAWLVVMGGTLALRLFSGGSSAGTSLALGFACTGLIGSLLGIGQALQGFSTAKIATVAQGITYMVSSCFAALTGLLAVAFPLQDRGRRKRATGFLRLVWYGFPILTLLIIALSVVMVMIPIKIENAVP
jgi:hypothetical protein